MRPLATICMLAAITTGCGSAASKAPTRAEDARAPTHANFTLYVSNQSFDRRAVDIRVEIDGQSVVRGDFEVEDQHNWVAFRLALREGPHQIRATSARGDARLRRTFHVSGKRWAVLDYWCCDDAADPRFTLDVSKRPIAFA